MNACLGAHRNLANDFVREGCKALRTRCLLENPVGAICLKLCRSAMTRGLSSGDAGASSSENGSSGEGTFIEELATPCFATELVVKRSRFIAVAGPAATVRDADAFIVAASEADARHNCWAYRLNEDVSRCSDDGEPQGTAGRPILAAIDRSGLDRVALVVVRYFGGVKLGASVLARTYGAVAAHCLAEAPRRRKEVTEDLTVTVPHAAVGDIFNAARSCTVLDVEYRCV